MCFNVFKLNTTMHGRAGAMGTNEAGGCLRACFSSHARDTGTSKSWVARDARATNVNINILSLHESRERIACVSKILR